MITHVDIIVTGRVQGVGFRVSARKKALQLGLSGWVKNQPNGSLALEVEGSTETIHVFIDWLKRGPMLAQVKEVVVHEGILTKYKSFEIRRDSL